MIDAIESFLDKHREEFPELTDLQIEKVCKTIFELTKKKIEEGNFETIRLMYFGSFKVFDGTVRTLKKKIEKGSKFAREKEKYLKTINKHLQHD